jgi:hypothetical protein
MYVKAMVGCLALWSAGALAQEAYVGGSLGQFVFEEEGTGSLVIDDTAPLYKVYGGYRFNDTWAVEGYLGRADDLTQSTTEILPGIGALNATVRAQYNLVEVRGLAHLKAFFAGIGYWESDLNGQIDINTVATGPFSVDVSGSDSGASLILGGEWDLGEDWGIRVEIEGYDMDGTESVYHYGFGVHYRF